MEQVVPIIPLTFSNTVTILSDRVTNFTYSAYNDAPSLSQHRRVGRWRQLGTRTERRANEAIRKEPAQGRLLPGAGR